MKTKKLSEAMHRLEASLQEFQDRFVHYDQVLNGQEGTQWTTRVNYDLSHHYESLRRHDKEIGRLNACFENLSEEIKSCLSKSGSTLKNSAKRAKR